MRKTLITLIFLLLNIYFLIAQDSTRIVTGKMTDAETGEGLIGASILLEGTTIGAFTDTEGNYTIKVPFGLSQQTLVFTYVGYKTEKVIIDEASNIINVALEYDHHFSSCPPIRYTPELTTIGTFPFNHSNPYANFHNDRLKNAPGLIINNSKGQVGRNFSHRGLGDEHIMLLENGNPITFAKKFSNILSEDMFIQKKINYSRPHVVHNSTASLTQQNTAGALITFNPEYRYNDDKRYIIDQIGLQANGNELYNKLEFFFNEAIDYDTQYLLEGFLRYDGGNRTSAYPFSQGGLVKAAFRKSFEHFTIELKGKYLNDRVGQYQSNFVQQWNNPQNADGFSWDDNWQLPNQEYQLFNAFNSSGNLPVESLNFNAKDQQHIKERAIHLELLVPIDYGTLYNKTHFSSKSLTTVEPLFHSITPYDIDNEFFNFELNRTLRTDSVAPKLFLGEAQFYDLASGEVLARTNTSAGTDNVNILENNLPNQQIIYNHFTHNQIQINEGYNRTTANLYFDNHQLTIENLFHVTDYFHQQNGGTLLMTAENQPRLLGLRVQTMDYANTFPDLNHLSNQTAQFTNPSGVLSYSNILVNQEQIVEVGNAVMASYDWYWKDWSIEAGLRYEWLWHNVNKADIYPQSSDFSKFGFEDAQGGLDGDELTVYDNVFYFHDGSSIDINEQYGLLSYNLGVLYRIYKSAIYLRCASNQRLTTTRHYFLYQPYGESLPTFQPQTVNQAEVGYRYTNSNFQLMSTAFINQQKNVYDHFRINSAPNQPSEYLYMYHDFLNYGLETYIQFEVGNFWYATGHFTLMKSENTTEGIITQPWSIQPIHLTNTFYLNKKRNSAIYLSFNRLGKRYANTEQAFELPAFSTVDIGLRSRIINNLTIALEVTNVFDKVGIYNFNGMTSLPLSADFVSSFFVENYPDEVFRVQRNLPRAMFLTIEYAF